MAPNTPRASVTRRAASAVKSSPSRTTRRSSSTPIDIASATTRGPSRRARPGSRRRASLRNLRTTSFSGLSISWLEAFLSNLHQPSKGTAVAHGQVSQHLAVDLHSGLAKAVHQLAVGQTRLPGGGVDACDPELPHLALAAAPVAVRVRERMEHRLVGGAKEQLLGKAEALGPIEDRLVAPMRRDSAFDACHSDPESSANFFAVRLGHWLLLGVIALALLRLVLEKVALPCAGAHQLAGLGHPDSLGETLAGLHLRHWWRLPCRLPARPPDGWAPGS